MNALNSIRLDKGLTFERLGSLAGYDRPTAWKHCLAEKISAEAAVRYSQALGIPLEHLRPDLFSPSAPPPEAPE
jgi:hypothetical protein